MRRLISLTPCSASRPLYYPEIISPLLSLLVVNLTDSRIQRMMRGKEEGRMTNTKTAGVYQIRTRRLQQLWARYRSNGIVGSESNLSAHLACPRP